MKVLLRDYVASLRERQELDAILPDLLSELGFRVFSRPQRGTTQRGVDIGAVGRDSADGEQKVYLFSVKAGDLTRQDWDGNPQALRPSLNEIQDGYIRQRIPAEYAGLKVVICLVYGGDVHEQVRDLVRAYTTDHTTDRLRFEEWNGDRLAELLLQGVLREKLLPAELRSSFQKAVAMVDEPEVAYAHFARLAAALRASATKGPKARLRAARQLLICAWILFAWARDVGNLEAAYRISELTILNAWELLRPELGRRTAQNAALTGVLNSAIILYLTVVGEFLEKKVMPHVGVLHGVSSALPAHTALDVNLALFDLLGRLATAGLWTQWCAQNGEGEVAAEADAAAWRFTDAALQLIENNPALNLPIADNQTVDIALLLQLWLGNTREPERVAGWLVEMTNRLDFAVRTRGRYPLAAGDYSDLADHPREATDDYFEEATAGSILIPTLTAWLSAFGAIEALETLAKLAAEKLGHCAMQLWSADALSEAHLYLGDAAHGRGLVQLPIEATGTEVIRVLKDFVRDDADLAGLSALRFNCWPVVFLACRHHRLPVPPGFWTKAMPPAEPATAPATA